MQVKFPVEEFRENHRVALASGELTYRKSPEDVSKRFSGESKLFIPLDPFCTYPGKERSPLVAFLSNQEIALSSLTDKINMVSIK